MSQCTHLTLLDLRTFHSVYYSDRTCFRREWVSITRVIVSPNKCESSTPYRTQMKGVMKLCYVFPRCLASLLPVQLDGGSRSEGIHVASVKDIKNEGIPSSGTFSECFCPVGK